MLKDCAMSGVRWYSGINLEFKKTLPSPYLSYPGESSSRFSPLEPRAGLRLVLERVI